MSIGILQHRNNTLTLGSLAQCALHNKLSQKTPQNMSTYRHKDLHYSIPSRAHRKDKVRRQVCQV